MKKIVYTLFLSLFFFNAIAQKAVLAKAEKELSVAPQFDIILQNFDLEIAKADAYGLIREFVS